MMYRYVHWSAYQEDPTDNNGGFQYGIESNEECPNYVEWFLSPEDRRKYAQENKLRIIGGNRQ
jgi:hypothetical protein